MRHFEYVGGGSEKFWEIESAGTTVTVRFGRLGTNGQTQVKDLGTDAAAEAHATKLVAEKVKKGYVQVGEATEPQATPPVVPAPAEAAPADPTPAEPTPEVVPAADAAAPEVVAPTDDGPIEPDLDEDTWTVPAAWWRQTAAIRGVGPDRPTSPDPDAPVVVAGLLEHVAARVEGALEHASSDPVLVAAARRHIGSPSGLFRRTAAEPNPLGAAVMAALLLVAGDSREKQLTRIADEWVLAHGAVFAAEAGALLADLNAFDPSNTRYYRTPNGPLAIGSAQGGGTLYFHYEPVLARLRSLLASVDDSTYADVVAALGLLRESPSPHRLATSYLAATEVEWIDADIAAVGTATLHRDAFVPLIASARTAPQVVKLMTASTRWQLLTTPQLLYGMLTNLGPAAAPVVATLLDTELGADDRKRLLSFLALFPTDEAFQLLVDRLAEKHVSPVVLEAMPRFPRRAMRLLAEGAAGRAGYATHARELLRGHVISHPTLVERVRPEISAAAGAELDAIGASISRFPTAGPDLVPAILAEPPWAGKRTRTAPVVIEGIGRSTPTSLAWKPGEQQAWANDPGYGAMGRRISDWPDAVRKALAGKIWYPLHVLAEAPEELVRPLLATFETSRTFEIEGPLRRLLGRYGDDATRIVLANVLARPSTLAGLLLPFEGSVIAAGMADWYGRSKSVRPVAMAWFDRHATAAARDLIPAALAKPGKERVAATTALRVIDQQGHREELLGAAATYGTEVVEAVTAVLDADPLQILPTKIPALPGWLDPAHLPPVLLPDRTLALPPEAVGAICTMFALSKPGDTYAGVAVVRDAVDPASLAEMAWGLLERWRGAGYPTKDGWVLDALGLVGDDETVRRLTPLIRAWPGESAHKRAVTGLDVLATIGTDVALMHLHGVAERVKFKGLKTHAKAKIEEVAEGLGLTADQLADRLVPDFGLDADGSLLLDYGPRRFRVGFDEQLKPTVADEDGSARKVLPKPGAKDDATLAPAAYARFSGLKKDVKTIAADQIRRFEQGMVAGRRWTAAEHRALFVDHPLLWHLARRLVWATFDTDDAPTGSFRVAEDRTLADVEDDELTLADDATVGIAHPLHLGATIGAWSDIFADYEILQPFPQLGREVLALTDEERSAVLLERITGLVVPTGKVLGLSSRGWERGAPQDAGIQAVAYKPVPGGRNVVVDLEPGIVAGEAMAFPEQTIRGVALLSQVPDYAVAAGELAFGLLDPITASEVLRDLAWLRP